MERELYELTQAIHRQTEAIEAMTVTNQRILEVLLEVVMQEQDPDAQPMHDMDGKPL